MGTGKLWFRSAVEPLAADDPAAMAWLLEGMIAGIGLDVYLSKIATSVMEAHAVEGIRLVLTVDAWPVSINVAMPTGLVVNELLTNALKHALSVGIAAPSHCTALSMKLAAM